MAEDQWESILHEASFGGVRIDVQSVSGDMSRALAKYKYPHRDGADIEDMGGEPRTERTRIIFTPGSRGIDHKFRFDEFMSKAQSGEDHPYVHPITGTFDAHVEGLQFEAAAEPRDTIIVTCEFVESTPRAAVVDAGPGVSVGAGSAEVAASVTEVTDAFSTTVTIPKDSTLGADAIATVSSWETDAAKTVRQVNLEMTTLSNRIAKETDALAVASDLKRYPLYRSFISLNANIRRAAQAFSARTPRLFEITLTVAEPLYRVIARTYGADEVATRVEDLRRLNVIPNPAWIPGGTVLKAPVPTRAR